MANIAKHWSRYGPRLWTGVHTKRHHLQQRCRGNRLRYTHDSYSVKIYKADDRYRILSKYYHPFRISSGYNTDITRIAAPVKTLFQEIQTNKQLLAETKDRQDSQPIDPEACMQEILRIDNDDEPPLSYWKQKEKEEKELDAADATAAGAPDRRRGTPSKRKRSPSPAPEDIVDLTTTSPPPTSSSESQNLRKKKAQSSTETNMPSQSMFSVLVPTNPGEEGAFHHIGSVLNGYKKKD